MPANNDSAKLDLNRIYLGDCLEVMQRIPAESVDLIISDPPFGTTQNGWDTPILLDALWGQINRIRKENAAIIFFGSGMFTAELMMSNPRLWRYNLIWEKGERATGFLNAHKMPMRSHEDIVVFYQELPNYNPQFTRGNPTHRRDIGKEINNTYRDFRREGQRNYNCQKFPKSVLKFDKPHPPCHPSEKPVPLLEYLIRTFSNEGETVLDFCIGSGTTAVAAVRTGRNFIGIDKEPEYVDLSNKRLETVKNKKIVDFMGATA